MGHHVATSGVETEAETGVVQNMETSDTLQEAAVKAPGTVPAVIFLLIALFNQINI